MNGNLQFNYYIFNLQLLLMKYEMFIKLTHIHITINCWFPLCNKLMLNYIMKQEKQLPLNILKFTLFFYSVHDVA